MTRVEGEANRTPEIWIVGSDGQSARRITHTTMGSTTRNGMQISWAVHPTWSPDGQELVYAWTQSGRSEIWKVRADGSGATRLTGEGIPDAPDANVPDWFLDGSLVTFWSGYETEYGEVWVMAPDGSGRRKVTETTDPHNSDNPHPSRRTARRSSSSRVRVAAPRAPARGSWTSPAATDGSSPQG